MSSFDDFEEFVTILEGGSDKAFRKMFREMGKSTRIRNQPRNARKAALQKGPGNKKAKQMEKEMMEMMGLGMMMPPTSGSGKSEQAKKKRNKKRDM